MRVGQRCLSLKEAEICPFRKGPFKRGARFGLCLVPSSFQGSKNAPSQNGLPLGRTFLSSGGAGKW